MQQFKKEIKRTLIVIIGLNSLLCVVAYKLGYSAAVPGLVLGVVTGLYTGGMLYRQVAQITGMPTEQAIAYSRTSWWTRFSAILVVLVITYYFSFTSFAAALVGWLSTQIALIASAMITVRKWFSGL